MKILTLENLALYCIFMVNSVYMLEGQIICASCEGHIGRKFHKSNENQTKLFSPPMHKPGIWQL